MDVGVDTFRSRLDLITWDGFRRFNGGVLANGTLTGGEPAFAGRHFLGGTDFLWGHGEATDCMSTPRPENLSGLALLTSAVAPVQAPFPRRPPHPPAPTDLQSRQSVTGFLGHAYGQVDGNALCNRLAAALRADEFTLPAAGRVLVWLSVEPDVPFSADYWAGWANQVNVFAVFAVLSGGPGAFQPFRAGVQCRFQAAPGGKLRPDAQVVAALTDARVIWPGSDSTSHACWADAPTAAAPDWAVFAGGPTPLLWRTAHGFNRPGFPPNPNFDVDVANPGGTVARATDFMLVPQAWQPNAPDIVNYGFIINKGNGIEKAQLPALKATPIPHMTDLGSHYHLTGGPVRFIGRYLKPHVVKAGFPAGSFAIKRPEAEMLSAAKFDIFTIWEDVNPTAGEPLKIDYFNPTHNAGTVDGKAAFAYCGDVLVQPPHTPVFFTVDFDAADETETHEPKAKEWILAYLTLVKEERDAYTARNPDRPYLIGIYGNGEVNRWCYRQGIVSFFWQSTGPGSSGNKMPFRPWFHANRWQFNKESELDAKGWKVVPGADPDADWGDGGSWNLRDPAVVDLEQIRQVTTALKHGATFGQFGNLILPRLP